MLKTALAAAVAALAFVGTADAQNKVNLRFAVGATENPNDGMSIGMRALQQYAQFKSRGDIEIRIFWNTLGGSLQVTEQVKNGTLDMALTDDSVLGSFHKPMQAFQIPYLFGSSMAAWEFANTPTVRAMVEDLRKATGMRTLAFSENGFRNLTNNVREVKTPEDMRGLKMRTMQSQVYVAFMQSMGASATPIAWPELIPALKTNVVDGQENASTTVLDGKLFEVQRFMSVNEHIYGFHLILINDNVFQRLSPDHQKIMMEAARLHSELANARKALDAIGAVDEIRKKGVRVYVNSPSEKEQFRKQTQQAVIDFIASQAGRDTVDKVLAAADEANKRVYGN
jgi:C4-dicarboxylate-binding protein DctP